MAWGSVKYWGPGPLWGQAYEAGAVRLLYMTRMGPNFRALVDIMDKRWAHLYGILEEIHQAFDLETCSGDRLDIIGGWLGRERASMEHERYRRALKVQRVVLASTGSGPNLLRVWSDWTQAAALEYRNVGPATVAMAGIVAAEDEALLVEFLQDAASGGVVFSVRAALTAPLICDSVASPVTDPGLCDSVAAPVAGARPTSYELNQ